VLHYKSGCRAGDYHQQKRSSEHSEFAHVKTSKSREKLGAQTQRTELRIAPPALNICNIDKFSLAEKSPASKRMKASCNARLHDSKPQVICKQFERVV